MRHVVKHKVYIARVNFVLETISVYLREWYISELLLHIYIYNTELIILQNAKDTNYVDGLVCLNAHEKEKEKRKKTNGN